MKRFQELDSLGIPGSFRCPPLEAMGMLYAVSIAGRVLQLSPRKGASASEFASFKLAAVGYNRQALIAPRQNIPGLHGRLLLGCGAEGVEAVSMARGDSHVLHRAKAGAELVVNHSDADSTGFKGLAADDQWCAFAVRAGAERFALTLLPLTGEMRPQQALLLKGQDLAGPSLCGRYVLLCTDRQVGWFDSMTLRSTVFDFPTAFRPLLRPSSNQLTVGPGGLPLAVAIGAQEQSSVWVAGVQGGHAGVLEIETAHQVSAFRKAGRGASMSRSPDGTVCLSSGGEVSVLRESGALTYAWATQSGMPVFANARYLCSFGDEDFMEKHTLQLRAGERTAELAFTDAACNGFSCCGVHLMGTDVLVSHLNFSSGIDGEGMKFTYFQAAG